MSDATKDCSQACFQSSPQKLISRGGFMLSCVRNAWWTPLTDSFFANGTSCQLFCCGVTIFRTSGIWEQWCATSHMFCVSFWKPKVYFVHPVLCHRHFYWRIGTVCSHPVQRMSVTDSLSKVFTESQTLLQNIQFSVHFKLILVQTKAYIHSVVLLMRGP
jgi:hypothetical protein